MNWFKTSVEIKDPKELLIWNKPNGKLERIISKIVNGSSNIQIIGERNSGKSSILNCIWYEIKNNKDNQNLIPVILNFNGYQDTFDQNNGYNLFSASILNEIGDFDDLKPDRYFHLINKRKIEKSNDLEGYIKILSSAVGQNSKTLFKYLVQTVAEKGYSIVMLIDEYESMVFNIFGGKKGSLYGIRDLITKIELPNSQYFLCCITGSRRWSDYGNKIGSDDLNFIDDTEFLENLAVEETSELIEYGVKASSAEIDKFDYNHIFKLTGGSIYQITSVCNSIIQNGNLDEKMNAERLYSHFDLIWNRLSNKYRMALKGKKQDPTVYRYLNKLNLIGYSDSFNIDEKPSHFKPIGKFWSDFVDLQVMPEEKNNNLDINNEQGRRSIEILQIGSSVRDLISYIMTNLQNKGHDTIFETTKSTSYWDYSSRISDLCNDKESMKRFIAALYIIIFESTQRFIFKLKKEYHEGETDLKEYQDIFEPLANEIKRLKNTNERLPVHKHPDKFEFILGGSKENVEWIINNMDDDINTSLIRRYFKRPMNMAAFPAEFNKHPKEEACPDVFYDIDALRHELIEGHDVLADTFETRRLSAAEVRNKYIGTMNEPESDDQWYKMQLGILKELNIVLEKIKSWAQAQKPTGFISAV